jgi:hypothetical protein
MRLMGAILAVLAIVAGFGTPVSAADCEVPAFLATGKTYDVRLVLRGIAKGEPTARLARARLLRQTALYRAAARPSPCERYRTDRRDDRHRL